jgi:hypothetical protein
MATIQEKSARLEAARIKAEQFLAAGGDMQSKEAGVIGTELVTAFADVAKEFGYEILKPLNRKVDFIRPDSASHS